jgi:hypothetical protein
MKTSALIAALFAVSLSTAVKAATGAKSADSEQRRRDAKLEHERRIADIKRLHAENMKKFPSQAARSRPAPASTLPHDVQLSGVKRADRKTPAFNPAAAPPPADCLRAYVAAARGANRMDDILKYLPQAQQRSLKEYQATYDPREAAESRTRLRQMNPKLDDKSLTFLSNPPFVNELNHHKAIAGKFLDVLSVETNGNEAKVRISTTGGGTFNGVRYPYSTATVDMVGEEGFWKVDSYNDANVSYLAPPQPTVPGSRSEARNQ